MTDAAEELRATAAEPPSPAVVVKSEDVAANDAAATTPLNASSAAIDETLLPKNRFELELEFVQALASPAYLHYLATNASSDDHNWLDDPAFIEYLKYLAKTWSRPEYNRYLVFPHGLYFLEWLLQHRREEWSQVAFRNFAHQQQFASWQHRAATLYGRGLYPRISEPSAEDPNSQQPLQSMMEG